MALYPARAELAYSVIPRIAGLGPALRAETQRAFAASLHEVWVVMSVLSGVGIVTVVFIRDFPLRKTTDKTWGLKERKAQGDAEGGAEGASEKVEERERESVEEKDAEVVAVDVLPSQKPPVSQSTSSTSSSARGS